MRSGGVNGTVAVETINAAATAIASLENRVPQASIQRRRWASCWSPYWCFGGSYKNTKRIGHGVFRPETSASRADIRSAEHSPQPPPIVLPFIAPPSSPASFLPSEPHSSAPSPTGMLSLSSVSTNVFSPTFVTGPYAHETQLVSPPVLSTFGTEPSTAPCTPPPESAHLTAPSSPEVPFARLLEFRSYQFRPGGPVKDMECTAVKKPIGMENLNGETSEEAHTDGENERKPRRKNRTATLGSAKEFSFEYMEEGSENWSFLPMVQTGLS